MIILNSFRNVKIFLIIILIAAATIIQPVYGDDEQETEILKPVISDKVVESKKTPVINALAAVVIEASSGRVLYSKNAAVKRSIASTTKIMTAIVALENGNLNDTVTISKRAADIGGSTLGMREGQEFTLKELLYAMLMISANDAAIAVAEHIGDTAEGFAEMMNAKARSIGAADSNFVTPHGLDVSDQYSTAYDMAIITRYALQNPVFAKIVATTDSSITGFSLYNTNELLGAYQGVDGVKTGYTGKAGRCLITTAQRGGMRVISVVFGSPTRSARANATKSLLDYSFENYKMINLINAGTVYADVQVSRGLKENVSLVAAQNIVLPLSDAESGVLEIRDYKPTVMNAPVYAGSEAGYVEYLVGGEIVAETNLTVAESIRRKNYFDYLADILKSWGKMMREGIFA
jgi:serine-type D-Ala-D-Ala carboxypeptidase (penicillin-binding protein 5/6)